MKKKIIILSTIIATIIVLGSCASSISANKLNETQSPETVKILVNQYYGIKPRTIETGVTVEEAKEIEELIIKLDEAITNNDEEAVSYYEKQLNIKGIFGNEYQNFYTNEEYNQKLNQNKKTNLFGRLTSKNGDNYSNTLCFFNALGKGILVSAFGLALWEALVRILSNASSYIALIILFLIFAPFVITGIVLTSLIPFRIMMPKGAVVMDEGKISSIGLQGFKSK